MDYQHRPGVHRPTSDHAQTGLYDHNARYYDPEIHRFISADTIIPNPADPQTLNRYSYVGNNPLTYTDPTGHRWLREIGGGIGVLAGKASEVARRGYETCKDSCFKVFEYVKQKILPSVNNSSPWDLAPAPRGNEIERLLGGNLGSTFPTIDKFRDGIATSIKSIDLTANSYQAEDQLFSKLKAMSTRLPISTVRANWITVSLAK